MCPKTLCDGESWKKFGTKQDLYFWWAEVFCAGLEKANRLSHWDATEFIVLLKRKNASPSVTSLQSHQETRLRFVKGGTPYFQKKTWNNVDVISFRGLQLFPLRLESSTKLVALAFVSPDLGLSICLHFEPLAFLHLV